jgi:hypothetical protein
MVTGFMCHEDADTAVERGLEGFKFFGFALAHYYMAGTHVPGRLSVWDEFKKSPPFPTLPQGGIGNPDQVRATLEQFETTGVDQVVFIQQGGRNRHEHICESLELFARRVQPGFKERHEARARRKAEDLAPHVARALERMRPLEAMADVPPVESYPVLMQKLGVDMQQLMEARGRSIINSLQDLKRTG